MKKNNKISNGGKKENSHGRIRGIRGGGRGGGKVGVYSKKFSKTITTVEPHRLEGVYIIKSDKEDFLATKNLLSGESLNGEKLITIEEAKEDNIYFESASKNIMSNNNNKNKVEYRIWDAFYSKLGATIINGIRDIFIKPGSKVLYLGAGSDSYVTISHISDLVGEEGIVYGVELSEIKGLDLKNMGEKRENIIPIINDARKPFNYKNIITNLVDCILVDISSQDISSIISINAASFLKNKGGFICLINNESQPNKIDEQIKLLRENNLYPKELLTLEPYKTGYTTLAGIYKP